MKKSRSNIKWILPIIVMSQFCCASIWFAGNGVMNELVQTYLLPESALGHLTSAVQFGFIIGTFLFALLTIADRFSPSKVFFVCALLGALFNFAILLDINNFISLIAFRFLVGFCLSGIYPVGMKIAADYFNEGLGKSLGYLVGALVVGTAFPHLLRGLSTDLPWRFVIILTSAISVFGGLIMLLFIPDGPYKKTIQKPDLTAIFKVFGNANFRSAAFGYFGHMWELYAFWAFIPVMLATYSQQHSDTTFNVPVLSFLIIGLGGLSCVAGGYISQKIGARQTAFVALFLSCICCLLSPFIYMVNSGIFLFGFLLFWGLVVIADSPLFSTLVAQNAIPEVKGTALTIVNCIGFSITIISIQLINVLIYVINPQYVFVFLAIGPILGLIALKYKTSTSLQNG